MKSQPCFLLPYMKGRQFERAAGLQLCPAFNGQDVGAGSSAWAAAGVLMPPGATEKRAFLFGGLIFVFDDSRFGQDFDCPCEGAKDPENRAVAVM